MSPARAQPLLRTQRNEGLQEPGNSSSPYSSCSTILPAAREQPLPSFHHQVPKRRKNQMIFCNRQSFLSSAQGSSCSLAYVYGKRGKIKWRKLPIGEPRALEREKSLMVPSSKSRRAPAPLVPWPRRGCWVEEGGRRITPSGQARGEGSGNPTGETIPCAAATWRKLSKSAEKKREMKPYWASSALAIREA